MDERAWWATVHGVTKSQTRLSDHFLSFFLVAQRVKNPPAMQETWVPSLGWEDPWRREQLPTPVSWPGEFHGQRLLILYSPQGCKESDMTERLSLSLYGLGDCFSLPQFYTVFKSLYVN